MKDDDHGSLVIGAGDFAVTTFFGYTYGSKIWRVDDAGGFCGWEMKVAPGERCADGFVGVAFAVGVRRKDPASFEQSLERRIEVALIFLKSDFSDKFAGGFFFDGPIAESEQRPMADVAEEADPGLFFGEGFAADEARDHRVAPESGAIGEIIEAVGAKFEARSFEGRDGEQTIFAFEHRKSVSRS